MTEYTDMIESKRKEILAEKWARGVQHIHVHSLKSMWYETRPQDTDSGNVIDITYNDGTVERELKSGEIIYMLENQLTGKALIDAWEKSCA
tara:strand:- start:19 stop:291 length:273 start_codon:yes stop_codon:yes gene_type:complete